MWREGAHIEAGVDAQAQVGDIVLTHIQAAVEVIPTVVSARGQGVNQRSGSNRARLQTLCVKLCISGQTAGPRELPSMLNQTVIINKSSSAWALWGTALDSGALSRRSFHLASFLQFN